MASLAALQLALASGIAVTAVQGTISYTIRSPHGEEMPGRCTIRSPHPTGHGTWPDPRLPSCTMGLAMAGSCRIQHEAGEGEAEAGELETTLPEKKEGQLRPKTTDPQACLALYQLLAVLAQPANATTLLPPESQPAALPGAECLAHPATLRRCELAKPKPASGFPSRL